MEETKEEKRTYKLEFDRIDRFQQLKKTEPTDLNLEDDDSIEEFKLF